MHCMWRVCGAADLIAGAHAFTACVCVRVGPIASSPHARRCLSCDTSRPACGDPRRTCVAHAHVSILPLGLPHVAHTWRMRTRVRPACLSCEASRSACGGLHRACMVHARIGAGGPAPLGKEALRVSGHGDPAPPSRSLLSPALAGTCPSGGTVLFCPQQAGYARTVAGLRVGPRECA